jgi:hypothetical protein
MNLITGGLMGLFCLTGGLGSGGATGTFVLFIDPRAIQLVS